jgi:hypothetical protein
VNRLPAQPGRRLGLALFSLAAVLTVLGVPMASAQGTTLFVANAQGAIPVDDPWAAEWTRVPALTVPLSGQAGVVPNLTSPTISSLRVRALRDDQRISFMVEWADATHASGDRLRRPGGDPVRPGGRDLHLHGPAGRRDQRLALESGPGRGPRLGPAVGPATRAAPPAGSMGDVSSVGMFGLASVTRRPAARSGG